ncbi:MAG: TlpA family protein disulfide reductase [Phycisphaerales bacterium]|nr:TlpA family protein disulfide reductase [Phycisphaerales bacterium]
MPILPLLGKLALVPAAIAAYVGVMGGTGMCPACSSLLASVTGSCPQAAAVATAEPASMALSADAEAGESADDATQLVNDLLLTLDGDKTDLKKFVGKPMVVEAWATWCPPCRKQRTIMKALADEMKGEVVFVGVSYDTGGPVGVQKFLENNPRMEHEFLSTPAFRATVQRMNRLNSIPKTMYIDRTGRVIAIDVGLHDAGHVRSRIAQLK